MKNLLLESHCIFPTSDIVKTANFYERKMGFKAVQFLDANEPHICPYRDTTEIILTKTNGQNVIPNRKLMATGTMLTLLQKIKRNFKKS
ncbi:hypothetical protein [Lysinibacillus xylanilyticus]|uniref:hypothetical protein n=1 Tax=Lysinibacillus xylanilyticus TaxID=582475 RepID=UPI003D037CD8